MCKALEFVTNQDNILTATFKYPHNSGVTTNNMNSKILSIVFASILAVLLVSAVSASLLSVNPSTVTLTKSTNSSSISVTPTNSTWTIITSSPQTLTDSAGNIVSIFATANNANNKANFTATYPAALKFGEYSTTFNFNATNTSNSSQTESVPVTVKFVNGFCKYGSVGSNLSITKVSISNSGKDDTEWKPLDEITVEVKVENNGDNDVKEVYAVLGLFDDKGKNIIGDMVFNSSDDEKVSIGTIANGKTKTATFEFTVPADFNFDAGSNYKFAVKAYSDKVGESKECIDTTDELSNNFYESISLNQQDDEEKFIAFSETTLSSDVATCSDIVTLSTKAYNVGDSDQDHLIVYLDNKALGVHKQVEFKNGLDMSDSVTATFEFTFPAGLKDGFYNLELTADYEDGSSDEPTLVPFKVIGCQIQQVVNQTQQNQTANPTQQTQESAWTSFKSAFSGNGLIWLVAAINLVLIIVIIIVAVRIARR